METVRVNIAYRPLRICWAIKAGDKESFRRAARISHALWGGRFNPIVLVDREAEAKSLVKAFRADVIYPLGDSPEVKQFAEKFPHLISPFFHKEIFSGKGKEDTRVHVLDIYNALLYIREQPQWQKVKERGIRQYTWHEDDALADIFLMSLGAYPAVEEVSIDYGQMLQNTGASTVYAIAPGDALGADLLDHPSVSFLSRYGLERHHGIQQRWDYPGFFLGDASNLDDLVAFWNLRAADITLWFVDKAQQSRYETFIHVWRKVVDEMLSYRNENYRQHVAIWSRREGQLPPEEIDALKGIFGEGPHSICGLSEHSWNGLNIRPPMMHFGEAASLGVLITDSPKPRMSFGLTDKPFSSDIWFHSQHLVASLSFIGGLYGNEEYTLEPPYIPELNEFYSRSMHFQYDKLRIESERVGIVINATETDVSVSALPVADLFKQVFGLAGYSSKVSSSGLITRQLITQLGGLRGAVVFKIPGVRRLLRTHGPTDAFTKNAALQLIGGKDPANPDVSFRDHEHLYIEPRERDELLTTQRVFGYMVEKGLFRIGAELTCTHCQMAAWTSLDALRQRLTCDMCGRDFDATRQLVDIQWHYRRSGVLGAERNAQGAVPVALTLQQLDANLSSTFREHCYSPSLDLAPKVAGAGSACEVDFAWIVTQPFPDKTIVILAECKDRGSKSGKGGDGGTIDEKDIRNLRAVADAFPNDRFEVYILLAKLCPFTPKEIELAKSLNEPYRHRVILLTDRELEPYYLYDRASKVFEVNRYCSRVEDLALATQTIFLEPRPLQTGSAPT
jgi:hypothetical protein